MKVNIKNRKKLKHSYVSLLDRAYRPICRTKYTRICILCMKVLYISRHHPYTSSMYYRKNGRRFSRHIYYIAYIGRRRVLYSFLCKCCFSYRFFSLFGWFFKQTWTSLWQYAWGENPLEFQIPFLFTFNLTFFQSYTKSQKFMNAKQNEKYKNECFDRSCSDRIRITN